MPTTLQIVHPEIKACYNSAKKELLCLCPTCQNYKCQERLYGRCWKYGVHTKCNEPRHQCARYVYSEELAKQIDEAVRELSRKLNK